MIKEEFKVVLHGSKRVLKQLKSFHFVFSSKANGQERNPAKIFLTQQSIGIIMILKTILNCLLQDFSQSLPRKHQNNNKFIHSYGFTPRLEKKKISSSSRERERERNQGMVI